MAQEAEVFDQEQNEPNDDERGSGRTRDELYDEAKALKIEGRSKMDKRQLEAAVDRRRGRR